MKVLMIIFVGLVIFLAGCVKENPTELKFKNDIVTIDNYFVSNVAPYEKGETSIQFDIHNNGDRKIPYLEVEFFDIPGFEIVSNSLKCEPEPISRVSGSKCIFAENDVDKNALEPLDARSITIQLNSTENISSPTPHTISFAVRYIYFGSGQASIPVIDGVTRKQPLTKFRLSDPSVGPIVSDIDPSIEREVVVGDKTIKENWAIGGANPLPFSAKFKFKHIGTIEKVKDVNISQYNVRFGISGLDVSDSCGDFKAFGPGAITDKFEIDGVTYQFPAKGTSYFSTKHVLVPFDILSCTFKPNINQPEYSASISVFFTYKYEFIKSQDFVVQPLPK